MELERLKDFNLVFFFFFFLLSVNKLRAYKSLNVFIIISWRFRIESVL